MPGPPPDPNAIRRNRRPDWVTLKAAGCDRPTPPWPFTKKATKAQDDLWRKLWATPQADMWHELGYTRIIGRYALLVIRSEATAAGSKFLGEVRQMEDRLGLTPMSMKRLQWEIGNAFAQGSAKDPDAGNEEPQAPPMSDEPPDLAELYAIDGGRAGA